MKAALFFKQVEELIPLDLSLIGDRVGFFGPGDPESLDVNTILLQMDYVIGSGRDALSRVEGDLIVLHHPPVREPDVPCYVIHSNWDIIQGGACDALADCLGIITDGVLDVQSGLGRVGSIQNGPVRLSQFVHDIMIRLRIRSLRIVNFRSDLVVERVGLVSGFGLMSDLVETAHQRGIEVFLSGDLTHRSAIIAKNLGLILVDAPHHATELPGLYRLGNLLQSLGVHVQIQDPGIPWKNCFLDRDSWE